MSKERLNSEQQDAAAPFLSTISVLPLKLPSKSRVLMIKPSFSSLVH